MIEFSPTLLSIGIIFLIIIIKGIKIVPQQEAWIIEKLGKFDRKLEPGLNFLIPFIENVAYKHTFKEMAINIAEQSAISKDNVTLLIDGILYVKIIDPVAASYGVNDPYYAISQLAQTTMRSEIGKMSMDKTFEERDAMNTNIVLSINEAAQSWGIQCMRYEIKDIKPPVNVLKAMELEVAAERQKRASILESEGRKQAQINIAEANKQETVLQSEASYTQQINIAKGQAEALEMVADANAKAIETVANAIQKKGGESAVAFKIAEKYVESFGHLAKESNTLIIPASASDAGSMVAQSLAIFDSIKSTKKTSPWKE